MQNPIESSAQSSASSKGLPVEWDELDDGIQLKMISELSFKLPWYEALELMGLTVEQRKTFKEMYNDELDHRLAERERLDKEIDTIGTLVKLADGEGMDYAEFISRSDEIYANAGIIVWEARTFISSIRQAKDGRRFMESFDFIKELPDIEKSMNVVGDHRENNKWFDIYMPETHPGSCPWVGRWARPDLGQEEERQEGYGAETIIEKKMPAARGKGKQTANSPNVKAKPKQASNRATGGKDSPPVAKRQKLTGGRNWNTQPRKKSRLSQVTNAEDLEDPDYENGN